MRETAAEEKLRRLRAGEHVCQFPGCECATARNEGGRMTNFCDEHRAQLFRRSNRSRPSPLSPEEVLGLPKGTADPSELQWAYDREFRYRRGNLAQIAPLNWALQSLDPRCIPDLGVVRRATRVTLEIAQRGWRPHGRVENAFGDGLWLGTPDGEGRKPSRPLPLPRP
jgi:hypothetical protein